MVNDLIDRLFYFAVKTIKFLRKMPTTTETKIIRYQLTKSATSAGANYEESQAGSSKADFIFKVEIRLREMRESNYWLRIIEATHTDVELPMEQLKFLIKESDELKNILASIVKKSKFGDS